jgi:DNA helicase-2/ATP-dependent DNA helicase PcrA
LEEGLFPSQSSNDDAKALEEERRLLYVGITRAMKKCNLYYALQRLRFGETVRQMPSRFVQELEQSGSVERITSFGTKPRERESVTSFGRESSYLLSGSPVVNGRTFTSKRREKPSSLNNNVAAGYYVDADGPSGYSQMEVQIVRGTKVFHETFGEGRVIEILGQGEKAKATVDFQKFGRKNLMLKFANLKVL